MITRNFGRHEFECKCGCGLRDPHPVLVVGLQRLREILRAPITVTSGCRCPMHNDRSGGSQGSFHMPHDELDGYSCAADIVTGFPLRTVVDHAELLEAFSTGGIGVYVDGTPRLHLDCRGASGLHRPASWAKIDGEDADFETALAEDERRRKELS